MQRLGYIVKLILHFQTLWHDLHNPRKALKTISAIFSRKKPAAIESTDKPVVPMINTGAGYQSSQRNIFERTYHDQTWSIYITYPSALKGHVKLQAKR